MSILVKQLKVLQQVKDSYDGPPTEFARAHGAPVFLNRVLPPPDTPRVSTGLRVLKEASSNSKLSSGSSRRITRGPRFFRDKKLFTLTLPERLTCPANCQQWDNCYGNNMHLAHRYIPGLELEEAIWDDLRYLHKKHPEGVIIRLHILGDFYSVGYVQFWRKKLHEFPNMGIYGYTHRRRSTDIGKHITHLVKDFKGRVSILRSDGRRGDPLPLALTVKKGKEPRKNIVVCPEQTGKTESCLPCGLCFNGSTSVQFLEH